MQIPIREYLSSGGAGTRILTSTTLEISFGLTRRLAHERQVKFKKTRHRGEMVQIWLLWDPTT